jgi:hypothetical protein
MSTKADRGFHMNPFNYWFKTNQTLNNFIENYYKTHINLIEDKELLEDSILLFKEGNASEKMQVLTLLSFIKQFLNSK